MPTKDRSALMFDEDEVLETTDPDLPRLIRIIFFALKITNESYLENYLHHYRELHRDKNRKDFSQKSGADRKTLGDRRKLTINMLRGVLGFMGWDIECISIRMRERLTGDVRTFSTDDTVEDIKSRQKDDEEIGVQSF